MKNLMAYFIQMLTKFMECDIFIIVIRKEVKEMEKEIFGSCGNCPYSCENCPYDENGWCCCEGDLPDDALCMDGYEDD